MTVKWTRFVLLAGLLGALAGERAAAATSSAEVRALGWECIQVWPYKICRHHDARNRGPLSGLAISYVGGELDRFLDTDQATLRLALNGVERRYEIAPSALLRAGGLLIVNDDSCGDASDRCIADPALFGGTGTIVRRADGTVDWSDGVALWEVELAFFGLERSFTFGEIDDDDD
jgi:hypothetical protein